MQRFPRTTPSNLRVFTSCLLSFLLLIAPMATLAASITPDAAPLSSEKASSAPASAALPQSSSAGVFNRFAKANASAAQQQSAARRGLFGSLMPAGPVIGATKVDTISDSVADGGNNDGNLDPGEKITYTVNIGNTGDADALAVTFNDTVHARTTLIGGSLNVSPLATNDTYETIANTLLEVGPVGTPSSRPKVTVTGSVFSNDTEFLGDSFTLKSVQGVNFVSGTVTASSTNLGTVVMDGTGKFSFTPKEGSIVADTFTYTITDDGPDNVAGNGDDLTNTATVTITVKAPRIWYVDNTAAPGGLGRSTDPFDTLLEAQTAAGTSVGDIVYVFTGNNNTTGQNSGFLFQANNQQLIGEGVALQPVVTVNGVVNPVLRGAGTAPNIGNSGGNGVSLTNLSGIVIRGFDIGGSTNAVAATFNVAGGGVTISNNVITGGTQNAIDVTTTATSAGGASAVITSNIIAGAGAEGIDINGQGSNGLILNIQDISLNATGTALDINGVSGGTLNITNFANISVSGSAGANGIFINTARFDSVPGGGVDPIAAGTTAIGATGNGVGGNGLVLISTTGTLPFTDLDIFADGGTGLDVTGAGAANTGITVGAGVGTITATNGPAVVITGATIDLQFLSISSNNAGAGTAGVSLTSGVNGTFSAGSGSSITNAAGDDFVVGSGTANITYDGPISSNSGNSVDVSGHSGGSTVIFNGAINDTGAGISLTNNGTSGGTTITFRGGVTASTGTNAAFTATGGGTVNVCTTTLCGGGSAVVNTLTTTTGTALNVANTTIGASGLTFRSISANGGANGIILNTTGSSGGLTVTGNGGTCTAANQSGCSGGTIQGMTGADNSGTTPSGTGIVLNSTSSVSLTRMWIHDHTNYGIRGTSVTGFTLDDSLVNATAGPFAWNGTNVNSPFRDSSIAFDNLLGTVNITDSDISRGFQDNLRIVNTTGSLDITVNNCRIHDTSSDPIVVNSVGGDGFNLTNTLTANITAHITNNTFAAHNGDHFNGSLGGSGTVSYVITGNNASGGHPLGLGSGFFILSSQYTGNFTYKISDNGSSGTPLVGNNSGGMIVVNKGSGGTPGVTSFSGRIENNWIGNPAVTGSGSLNAGGIQVEAHGKGSHTTLINNNKVRQFHNAGIELIGGESEANVNSTELLFDATITNNTVSNPDNLSGASGHGIHINMGTLPNDKLTACMDVQNKTPNGTLAGAGEDGDNGTLNDGQFDLRIRQRQNANVLVRLPGFAGGANADAFETGQNTLTTVATSAVSTFGGGGACATAANISWLNMDGTKRDDLARTNNLFRNSDAASSLPISNIKPYPAAILADINQTAQPASIETQADNAKPSQSIARGNNVLDSMLALVKKGSQIISSSSNQTASKSVGIGNDSVALLSHANSSRSGSVGRLSTNKSRKEMQLSHAAKTRISSAASTFMPSGETITPVVIGILKPTQSVTIQFQVTLDNPPNLAPADLVGGPHVSNQGSVTYTGGPGGGVLTDDPSVGGSNNPTETPVDLFDTQTTVITSNASTSQGESVTFTATVVSNPAGNPNTLTGTVDFFDGALPGGIPIGGCTGVTLTSGQAQCTTAALPPGVHTITARYNGDGNFDPSEGTVSQTVIACAFNPIVTSTADSGANTLREAITTICPAPNNVITFNLPGAGPHTITLTTGALVIDKNLIINNASGERITVSGNNASRVFVVNATRTATIKGLTISGGQFNDGGGIRNQGTLNLLNSTVTGNNATAPGGGIYNDGVMTIINTTISGNNAGQSGGGINNTGTLTVINSTITNNRADSDNNASGTGGGIAQATGTVTLHNTIVAGNFNEDGASDAPDDLSGTFDAASSFNLIGDFATSSGLTHGANGNIVGNGGAGTIDISTVLNTTLAFNGGVTQTHALVAGSVALDAGSNANLPVDTFDADNDTNVAETLPVDQRGAGFGRTRDAADADTTQTVDIGAFEADPSVENITDKTTTEDTALPTFIFNVGDSSSAFDSITATSSNLTLVPNANITVGADTPSTRSLSITPAANQSGTTTITVTVTKTISGTVVTMTDTFVLTVSEINDTPVAGNDPLSSVAEDSGQRFILYSTLLANDSPPTGDAGQTITIISVGSFVGGTAVLDNANSRVVFTPTADYNGPASFQYTIEDNGTTNGSPDPKTATATVSFTITEVNDTPVPANDSLATVPENSPQISIPFSAVTTNDSRGAANESGQTLVVQAINTFVGGTFILDSPNSQILFTPTANYTGPASFNYTVTDNGTTNGAGDPKTSAVSATASFSVGEVNDPPTAVGETISSVVEDSGQRIIPYADILGNDVKGPANESGQTLVVKTVSNPVGGTVVNDSANSRVLFTLDPDFNGAASFQYNVEDNGTSGGNPDPQTSANVATTSFTVTEINDAPVVVADSLTSVAEDSGQRIIPFSDLTTNDNRGAANESAQTLSVTSVTNPVGGTATLDIPNSRVLFTPNADFHGTASFDYTVIDNGTTNGASDPKSSAAAGTASFSVTPVADTPTVTDATTTINTQTTDGLVIDRNAVDGAEVTHFKITNITNGTLFQNDGSTQINDGDFITYAEGNAGLRFKPDFNKNTPAGDTFSFQVQGATDDLGNGLSSNFATATITVNCQTGLIVTSTADDGSAGTLRHAIANACPGSTITFNLGAGPHTIVVGSELFIDKDLTITGSDSTSPVTLSGGNTTHIFTIQVANTVNLSNLTIINGQKNGNGGAVFNLGNLTITNSTLTGNKASGDGGAIDSDNGTLTIHNSTISGNEADRDGGGLHHCGSSTATLVNVTITNNRADADNDTIGEGGGIAQISSNPLTLHNTIVAGNFNEDGASDANDDVFVNTAPPSAIDAGSSNNLIGVDTGLTGISHGTNGNQVGTAGSPIDPLLGPLASNGGPTQTHALLTGSPALDAGDNTKSDAAGLTTDQRGTGFARKADSNDPDTTDTVDIGAFEALASVENIPDQTINEDNSLNLVFTVGDAESITSVTASSGNTTLVPNNAANITVNAGPTTSQRTLVINPATDQNGTSLITVTVTSGAVSVTDTFTLTVNAVNDAPSFTKGPDQTASGNNPQTVTNWATNILAGPADEAGQTVDFNIVSNSDPALFSVQPDIDPSGTLTYTPLFGVSGTATIVIELKDNGGTLLGGQDTSAQQSFLITVSPIGWTTTGNSGVTEDESNPAKPTYTNFTAGANAGSPAGTYVLRYNITAMGNLTSLGSANTRLRVRFRDEGAGSRVVVAIIQSPITGGATTIGTLFDSNAYAPGSGFQTQEILMPALVFDFTQNTYWLEVTMTKDDAANQPGIGTVQINQQ